MAKITEDYVSFETAKLLKEKRFNPLNCGMYYSIVTGKRTTELLTSLIACPTQQMVMRWLREVYKLYVNILYSEYLYGNKPFYWYVERLNEKSIYERIIKTSTATREYTYGTYEEAVEAAIKYCLENLI